VGDVDRPTVVVVGCGYVGLNTAAGLADLGAEVLGVEADPDRLDLLHAGRPSFFEPDLEELVAACVEAGRLSFMSDLRGAGEQADIAYVCVPTPESTDGSADLSIVEDVAHTLGEVMPSGSTVVLKSTVPVGTCDAVATWLARDDVDIVSNPEFLQAGRAVASFRSPDRIVIGSWTTEAGDRVERLFAGVDAPVVRTDPRSAELIKYASNAYLALRLSFVNTVAEMCELGGGNAWRVMEGMGLDRRIGTAFLQPGPGWGGSCLPKDVRAMAATGLAVGADMSLLDAARHLNERRFDQIVSQVEGALGGSIEGRRIAVWGLTFKAGTDDLRDSPALAVLGRLLDAGATVLAYDPMVRSAPDEGIVLCDTSEAAVVGAECLLVLTEWPEFADASASAAARTIARRLVVDARGVLDADRWMAEGFEVHTVGVGHRSGD